MRFRKAPIHITRLAHKELVDLEMYIEDFRTTGLNATWCMKPTTVRHCSEELLKEFDSIRDAWHWRSCLATEEWLSFLFTCENQLMLALLQEKHYQAGRLMTLMSHVDCKAIYDSAQWVGSIQDRVFDGTNLKREREALESKPWPQRGVRFKSQKTLRLHELHIVT